MGRRMMVIFTLAAGVLLLGAQAASASPVAAKTADGDKASASRSDQKSEARQVRGVVVAVEPHSSPMTLTLNTAEGKQQLTVGVDITDQTMIREGKVAKSLGDIKVGDHVWLEYRRSEDSLVADAVRIRPLTHLAAAPMAGGKKAR